MKAEQAQQNGSVLAVQLSFAEPDVAANICRQTHSALQWLARLANSYVEAKPDASHLWLRWTEEREAIASPEIAPGTTVELQPHKFYLQFCENGRPTRHPVTLDDISPARVEAWCLIELLHRNLDRDRFSKDLPYDVDGLMKGDAEEFETYGREEIFERLGTLLSEAAALLKSVQPDDQEIGVDPRDFTLFRRVGRDREIGLCLGDREIGHPFYYRSSTGTRLDDRPRSRAAGIEILTAETIASDGKTLDDILAFLAGDGSRGG